MAYTAIPTTDVDAKSPVSDDWTTQMQVNQEHFDAMLADGASAPATLTTNKLEAKSATGNGLDVTNDGQIGGNLNVTGTLTVGSFVVPETALIFLNL